MRRLFLAAMLSVAAVATHAAPLTNDDFKTKSNKEIEAALPETHPAAYFAYAMKLYNERKQEQSTLWYYIGQIRFRQHLLAHPELPAEGDPNVYKQYVDGPFGKAIADWNGAVTRVWVKTIEKALDWDNKNPNVFSPKETQAAQWEQARAEVDKIRVYVKTSEAEIKSERASRGLSDNR